MRIVKKTKEKRSTAQIIIDTIVNIVMAAAVALFVLALITVYKNQDSPNEAFLLGYKPVYVMTGSMEPTLRVNGIVIIKEASYDEIVKDYKEAADGYVESEDHKNDERPIVMYEIDDKMITHRVVDVTEEGIRTKGDNNNVQDAYYLQPENIRGEVVAVWNWTATLVENWKNPAKRVRMIVFAIAIIIFLICLPLGIKMMKKAKPKSSDTVRPDTSSEPNTIPAEPNSAQPISIQKARHALSKEESDMTLYVSALYDPHDTN